MSVAQRLERFLTAHAIPIEPVVHPPTASAGRSAEQGHVPGDRVAKSVLLKDARGYVLAVLPATRHILFKRLQRGLNRPLELATEADGAAVFTDCDLGAFPAVGTAYGLEMVVDPRLDEQDEVYIEGGDHTTLLHLSAAQFRAATERGRRLDFSFHD